MTARMDMMTLLSEARDAQMESWPLARENYLSLGSTERRVFKVDDFTGAIQFNPARAVSTGASIDAASISRRPCFLCGANRPLQQSSEEIIPGWEFLVNPYPIFPLHFTIASMEHRPQDRIPLDMASMAEKLPGMTVFFNGARAGASAPDHLHCQAVPTAELPLMRYLEGGGDIDKLPFIVYFRVITPDFEGMRHLNEIVKIKGKDRTTGEADARLVNAYMWIGADGLLRVCVIPRSAHRPSFYDNSGMEGYMVSPGAIDMAGVMILPRKEDFIRMDDETVNRVYSEVALQKITDK